MHARILFSSICWNILFADTPLGISDTILILRALIHLIMKIFLHVHMGEKFQIYCISQVWLESPLKQGSAFPLVLELSETLIWFLSFLLSLPLSHSFLPSFSVSLSLRKAILFLQMCFVKMLLLYGILILCQNW